MDLTLDFISGRKVWGFYNILPLKQRFMPVLAFSWAVLNCMSINISSTGDAHRGNSGPESSGASRLKMQADKECIHMDCLGEDCVFRQVRLESLTVLTWAWSESGEFGPASSQCLLCHFLKLLSAKSPKQTNPFAFWFIYLEWNWRLFYSHVPWS